MAFELDASKEASAPIKEQKASRLKEFGRGVVHLLEIIGQAKREEIVYGHGITDPFPVKSTDKKALDLEKINSIH